jgi:rSAM/selenodomain-associated transferase 2
MMNADHSKPAVREAIPPPRSISVVIPVLNEEKQLATCLRQLESCAGIAEILVVDGGSTDCTVEIALSLHRVRVLIAPRGRASQMNTGAFAAQGDVLLFLHADARLPPTASEWIARALSDPTVTAGAFKTWTVCDEERSWLSPLLHLADLRSRYSGLPYGDQALFLRAETFRALGGFPDQPLMEDLEFARRLRKLGRICTVPACVRVSGRRFLRHPLRYAAAMNVFPLLYRLGVSAGALARLYGDPR